MSLGLKRLIRWSCLVRSEGEGGLVCGKKNNLFPLAENRIQSLFRTTHSLVTKQTELSRISDCATGWTDRCSNPGAVKRIYSSSKRPDRLCGLRSRLFNVYWGYFVGVMRTERDGNRSLPYSVEVQNEWIYTCTKPTWLYGADRETFTFTLTFTLCVYISNNLY